MFESAASARIATVNGFIKTIISSYAHLSMHTYLLKKMMWYSNTTTLIPIWNNSACQAPD